VSFGVSESMAFLVSGLYDFGFTSIDDSGQDDDVKNQAFYLNVGLGWLLGG
jgi:hypothetical protein